jgi:Mg2+ and Co2+ transporter CorA
MHQLCYIGYDAVRDMTTCVVSSGEDELFVERTKVRIKDHFAKPLTEPAKIGPEALDPFLVQSILCQESLLAARKPITELRHRLYDVLDVVGEYSKEPFDRSNLKEMTDQLHKVCQDADSLAVSVEMGLMIAQNSSRGWNAIRTSRLTRSKSGGSTVGDSLDYITRSLESQLRWLQSYKSRKDIAMNLVFNLVTQQDSETSTSIARDTKDDSASMKIIAVLTMIFLPATAVATFFGMSLFDVKDDGTLHVSELTWLYAVVTVLLTVTIFLFWLYWYSIFYTISRWRKRQKQSISSSTDMA